MANSWKEELERRKKENNKSESWFEEKMDRGYKPSRIEQQDHYKEGFESMDRGRINAPKSPIDKYKTALQEYDKGRIESSKDLKTAKISNKYDKALSDPAIKDFRQKYPDYNLSENLPGFEKEGSYRSFKQIMDEYNYEPDRKPLSKTMNTGGDTELKSYEDNVSQGQKIQDSVQEFNQNLTGKTGIPNFREEMLAKKELLNVPDQFDTNKNTDYLKAKYRLGQLNTLMGEEAFKEAKGQDNMLKEVQQARMEMVNKYPQLTDTDKNYFIEGVGEALEMAPLQIESIKRGAKQGVPGALTAGGLAAAYGQAGPQVLAPEEIVTVPAAAAAGFKAASSGASADYIYKVEKGNSYIEMIDQGVDPQRADFYSDIVGAVNAGIEVAQIGTLIKNVGVVKNILNTPALKKTVTNKGLEILKEYSKAVLKETFQEIGQETTAIAGEGMATRTNPVTAESGQRIVDTAIQSFKAFSVSMGISSLTGGATQVASESYKTFQENKKNVQDKAKKVIDEFRKGDVDSEKMAELEKEVQFIRENSNKRAVKEWADELYNDMQRVKEWKTLSPQEKNARVEKDVKNILTKGQSVNRTLRDLFQKDLTGIGLNYIDNILSNRTNQDLAAIGQNMTIEDLETLREDLRRISYMDFNKSLDYNVSESIIDKKAQQYIEEAQNGQRNIQSPNVYDKRIEAAQKDYDNMTDFNKAGVINMYENAKALKQASEELGVQGRNQTVNQTQQQQTEVKQTEQPQQNDNIQKYQEAERIILGKKNLEDTVDEIMDKGLKENALFYLDEVIDNDDMMKNIYDFPNNPGDQEFASAEDKVLSLQNELENRQESDQTQTKPTETQQIGPTINKENVEKFKKELEEGQREPIEDLGTVEEIENRIKTFRENYGDGSDYNARQKELFTENLEILQANLEYRQQQETSVQSQKTDPDTNVEIDNLPDGINNEMVNNVMKLRDYAQYGTGAYTKNYYDITQEELSNITGVEGDQVADDLVAFYGEIERKINDKIFDEAIDQEKYRNDNGDLYTDNELKSMEPTKPMHSDLYLEKQHEEKRVFEKYHTEEGYQQIINEVLEDKRQEQKEDYEFKRQMDIRASDYEIKESSYYETGYSGEEYKQRKIDKFEREDQRIKDGDGNTETYLGITTAGFEKDFSMDPKYILENTEGGMAGEHRFAYDQDRNWWKKVEDLKNDIEKNGYDQDTKVMVAVNNKGEAYIYEGNKRVRAAIAAGINDIPVEVKYYDFGNEVSGNAFSPGKVIKHIVQRKGKNRLTGPDALDGQRQYYFEETEYQPPDQRAAQVQDNQNKLEAVKNSDVNYIVDVEKIAFSNDVDQELVENYKQKIKENGIKSIEPIEVIVDELEYGVEDYYKGDHQIQNASNIQGPVFSVEDGNHRLQAAKELGIDNILVKIANAENESLLDIKEINPTDQVIEDALDNVVETSDGYGIDYQRAYDAYRNISMSPDRRATQTQESFVREVNEVEDEVMAVAETEEMKEVAEKELDKFKEGYLKRYNDMLDAKSRVASVMVTGPANFDHAKNQKRNETEVKRTREVVEYRKNAADRIIKKVKNAMPEEMQQNEEAQRLIRAAKETIETLDKIEKGEGHFAGFDKSGFRNSIRGKISRSAKNGNIEAAQQALDYVKENQDPNNVVFSSRNGIWNEVQEYAEKIEAAEDQENEVVKEYDGAVVETDILDNRVKIFFDEKPSKDVRSEMKSHAWRWSPSNEAWQRKLTDNAKASATRILDKFYTSQQTKDEQSEVLINIGYDPNSAAAVDFETSTYYIEKNVKNDNYKDDSPKDILLDIKLYDHLKEVDSQYYDKGIHDKLKRLYERAKHHEKSENKKLDTSNLPVAEYDGVDHYIVDEGKNSYRLVRADKGDIYYFDENTIETQYTHDQYKKDTTIAIYRDKDKVTVKEKESKVEGKKEYTAEEKKEMYTPADEYKIEHHTPAQLLPYKLKRDQTIVPKDLILSEGYVGNMYWLLKENYLPNKLKRRVNKFKNKWNDRIMEDFKVDTIMPERDTLNEKDKNLKYELYAAKGDSVYLAYENKRELMQHGKLVKMDKKFYDFISNNNLEFYSLNENVDSNLKPIMVVDNDKIVGVFLPQRFTEELRSFNENREPGEPKKTYLGHEDIKFTNRQSSGFVPFINQTPTETYQMNYDVEKMISNNEYKPGNLEKSELKPIHEIIQDIEHDFKISVTDSRYNKNRNAYAIYKHHPKVIETSVANTIGAVMHELGHHLDMKYKFTESPKFSKAINDMISRMPESFKSNYKENQLGREALAEFLRLYMTAPTDAIEFAKEFMGMYLNTISDQDRVLINKHRDDILEWLGSNAREQINSHIVSRMDNTLLSDIRKNPWRSFKSGQKKAYKFFIDSLAPIEDLVNEFEKARGEKLDAKDNFYLLADHSKHSSMVAKAITVDKLLDPQGNVIGPGFKEILEDIDVKEYNDFNNYLVLKRAIDYMNRGKRVFSDDIQKEYIIKLIHSYETEKPHFERTAQKVYDWWTKFNQAWIVDTGLIDQEAYEHMRELEPHYVPFFRAKEEYTMINGKVTQLAKKGFVDQRNPYKRSSKEGSGDPVLNPIESFITEIDRYVKTVKRHKVMQKIHEVYQDTSFEDSEDGLGWLINQVNPQMTGQSVNIGDKKAEVGFRLLEAFAKNQGDQKLMKLIKEENFTKALARATAMGFQGMDIVDEVLNDIEVDFMPMDIDKENNIISVKGKDGKTYHYEIYDKYLLEALVNLDNTQIDKATRMVMAIRRGVQSFITTFNPLFMIRNFLRDMFQGAVGSDVNLTSYVPELAKAIYDEYKGGEWSTKYRQMGGGYASPTGASRDALFEALDDVIPGYKDKSFTNKVRHMLGIIERISDAIEQGPRIVEFKNYIEKNGDSYSNRLQAMFEAQDITVNFSRKGEIMQRWYAQLIPFFNAAIQGVDKFRRLNPVGKSLKGDKQAQQRLIKTATRAFVSITMIQLAQMAIFKDDEEYKKIAGYIKDNYWLLPTGIKGKYIRIPKPREIGMLYGSGFERMFESLVKQEGLDAWEGYVTNFRQMIIPPARTILAPLNDVRSNTTWYGGDIVPYAYQDLQKRFQYDKNTSVIARTIAKVMPEDSQFASPFALNYLMKQYLGGLGRIIIPLTDEVSGNNLETFERAFTADSAYSNDDIRKFYDRMSKLDSIRNTAERKKDFDGFYNKGIHDMYRIFSDTMSELYDAKDLIAELRSQSVSNQTIIERVINDTTLDQDIKVKSLDQLDRAIQYAIRDMAAKANNIYEEAKENTKQ